jgi:hypothetical protein
MIYSASIPTLSSSWHTRCAIATRRRHARFQFPLQYIMPISCVHERISTSTPRCGMMILLPAAAVMRRSGSSHGRTGTGPSTKDSKNRCISCS